MYAGTSKVTRSGQVTLPLSLRKAIGISEGSEVVFIQEDEDVRILTLGQLEEVFRRGDRLAKKEKITRNEIQKRIDAARKQAYADRKG